MPMFQPIARDSELGLMMDQVALSSLAEIYGTPLYVYSKQCLIANYHRIADAFAPISPLIAFSMKSNSNGAILRTLIAEGSGLDIVSGGELSRGLRAGADPSKIIFAGVGKTHDEIAAALKAGIRMFNIESEPEAEHIAYVAKQLNCTACIAVRVNPDIDAGTHKHITTGLKENKFGISFDTVRSLCCRIASMKGVILKGLHCHIGSQILKMDGYLSALDRMAELIDALKQDGHTLDTLNLGGGFGIAYSEDQSPMDVSSFSTEVMPKLKSLGLRIILEPGRSISGTAGVLLTHVTYVKEGDEKHFAIVDAAMNDLVRPSFYDAYHKILPVNTPRLHEKLYDVVGPICESGDFLAKKRVLHELQSGDLLAICEAGAYGMVMASNYNSRPRAAEVMVSGSTHTLIRRRETFEDLVAQEII